jgi:murein DD-endopeptidase MepM/ murein hydrolase activator NlpD
VSRRSLALVDPHVTDDEQQRDGTQAPAPRRGETIDYRLEDFVIDPAGKKLRPLKMDEAVTGSGMTLSIEESSSFTLDIFDEHRALLRSDLLTRWAWGTNADDRNEKHWMHLGRKVFARLDDLDLELSKQTKSGDTLTLLFEQEAVLKLRAKKGVRKAQRFDTPKGGGVTRAQFIASLCREAGVEFHIPEISREPKVLQPATPIGITTKSTRRKQGKKGLDTSAHITVKGVAATATQIDILQRGLDVGNQLGAPDLAMLALIVAAIGESTVSYIVNSAGYGGPWQGQVNTGGHYFSAHDVEGEAHSFFKGVKGYRGGGAIHLARKHPGMSPGAIADLVEGGGAGAHFYDIYGREARKILRAFSPGFNGSGVSISATTQKPYNFERQSHENSWDTIQRLAGEVHWRAFVRGNVLWYASEEYLFNQAPQIVFRERRVATTPEERHHAVDSIDGDIDQNARNGVAEMSVTARASRWTAEPGMVAIAREAGAFDGRWIVASVERESLNVENDVATITCHKPMPDAPEPAPETVTQTFSFSGPGSSVGTIQGYVNPFRRVRGLTANRIDMGVDYGGTGPVLAIGDAKVYAAASSGTRWPGGGFIGYTLLNGPYKGKHVFIAENVRPSVRVGSRVRAGQVIGHMSGGIETGWGSGVPYGALAAKLGQQASGDPGAWMSAAGYSFNKLLVALGVKSGTKHGSVHGKMPRGFP